MPSARPKTMDTAPQQIDRDTFSQYSTAIKERSQLQERKAELESYTTVLRARIAQIAVHVQEPENDSLLLALEQEYTSASQKMRDAVSSFVSVMESITLKYNYRISSNKRCTSNSSCRDRELAEIVVALD